MLLGSLGTWRFADTASEKFSEEVDSSLAIEFTIRNYLKKTVLGGAEGDGGARERLERTKFMQKERTMKAVGNGNEAHEGGDHAVVDQILDRELATFQRRTEKGTVLSDAQVAEKLLAKAAPGK